MRKIRGIFLIVSMLVMGTAVAGLNKLNAELAGATYEVQQVNYQAQIIYVDGYELSYNANTKFITKAGFVKPTAVKPGSLVRFAVSNKNLQSLRTIVSEVRIKILN